MAAAIQNTFQTVIGTFESRNIGRRTEEKSHDWAPEAAAAIAENPADVVEWLKLADRLDEEGNPAAHIIRALFEDGYELPKNVQSGRVYRGGRYYESGEHYSEGCSIEYNGSDEYGERAHGWYFHGAGSLSVGGFHRAVTREEARDMLKCKHGAHCGQWREMRVEARVSASAQIIPAGTVVMVWKQGQPVRGTNGELAGFIEHKTEQAIRIPDQREIMHVVTDSMGRKLGCWHVTRFEHRGYVVAVANNKVQGVA